VDSYQLNEEENGCSVISCRFKEDSSNEYYVIGTAYAIPTEAEPTKGRLLVFSVVDHKLKFIHELTTTGAVYSLNSFNGNLLAGINSTVSIPNTSIMHIILTVCIVDSIVQME
jgi:DNA damage-binding protein 1